MHMNGVAAASGVHACSGMHTLRDTAALRAAECLVPAARVRGWRAC